MREGEISTKKFRQLTAGPARLLAYEACKDFALETAPIDGWAGPVAAERIEGKKFTVVPILRAGLALKGVSLRGVVAILLSRSLSSGRVRA